MGAKSHFTARLQATHPCKEPPGSVATEPDEESEALEDSQPIGLWVGWGCIVHLAFLLSREHCAILAPLVPLSLVGSLSNCVLCFLSWGVWGQ